MVPKMHEKTKIYSTIRLEGLIVIMEISHGCAVSTMFRFITYMDMA
jgi:hypothetical protein